MAGRIDNSLQFHQAALSLRAARHELLASNIANADTPNYKAKDIDFSSALQTALGNQSGNVAMSTTSSGHLPGGFGNSVMGAPTMYRTAVQPSADGNTVDMDVERAQFVDNSIRYEASLKFVGDQVKDVLAALQG